MQKKRTMIVDGYNVIRRVPEFDRHFRRSPEAGREALIRYCTEWQSMRRDVLQFCLVFDGKSSVVGVRGQSTHGVRVIYSNTGETADRRILALIEEGDSATTEHVVVSDDNEIARNSRNLDADVMSVSEFYGVLRRNRKSQRRTSQGETKTPLSPREEKEITENLLKEWGID